MVFYFIVVLIVFGVGAFIEDVLEQKRTKNLLELIDREFDRLTIYITSKKKKSLFGAKVS